MQSSHGVMGLAYSGSYALAGYISVCAAAKYTQTLVLAQITGEKHGFLHASASLPSEQIRRLWRIEECTEALKPTCLCT